MFRVLLSLTVFVTLLVNLILLFATKDKPPDPASSTTTLVSVLGRAARAGEPAATSARRRLFLRSNDFYDYSAGATGPAADPHLSEGGEWAHASDKQQPPAASAGRAVPGTATVDSNSFTPQPDASEPAGPGTPAARDKRRDKAPDPSAGPPRSSSAGAEATQSSSNGNRNTDGERANEITRRPANTLALRVKSSRNHVLIKVDNLITYESGWHADADADATTPVPSVAFSRRARRHFRPQRSAAATAAADDANANAAADRSPAEPAELGRGLHVLVLNQFDGAVMSRRRFDTYLPQQDDELAFYLGQIQDGRLVVMAVQDEASFKMGRGSAARRLIRQTLGSRRIMELGWRDMWALVARKRLGDRLETNVTIGGRPAGPGDEADAPLAEGLSRAARFTDWAAPVELSLDLRLEPAGAHSGECPWPDEAAEVRAKRRHFCGRIEGYGRLCDCRRPSRLEFAPAPIERSQLLDVPIVVMASNRPYYLYRMLRSLLQATGVQASMVTVFIDGFYDEPREICKLFNLRHVENKPLGLRSARISHHYKASLAHTFERLFPEAEFAIIFEEDLDVARDALVFFNQTRALLRRDPSLYCASAWNDQGYEQSVGEPARLLRVETMPGLGWMLSRRLFVEELRDQWPSASQQHDWDMWIRTPAVRRGRECVIPEVSRTFHFGSVGTNINSYFQRQYFSKHAFSDNLLRAGAAPAQFGADSLDAAGYEHTLWALLQGQPQSASGGPPPERRWFSAEMPVAQGAPAGVTGAAVAAPLAPGERLVVMSAEALCGHAPAGRNETAPGPPSGGQTDTLDVIFIKMIDSEDFRNWLKLAKCWRLWDLDARGQHKSMWRLSVAGRQTLVIGHPASPYSRLRPAQVTPYDY